MSDEPTILMARQPARFEARNCRGKHKRLKSGSIWLIEMEVDRETWDLLDTMPDNALLETVLWWSDGDPTGTEKPTAKKLPPTHDPDRESEPYPDAFDGVAEAYPDSDGPAQPLPLPEIVKEKGKWGPYWSKMYSKHFDSFPELLKELKVNGMGDSVKVALRARFNCPSLTMVSPDMFERWVLDKHLPDDLIKKSRRSWEELGGLEYKWGKKDKTEAA